MDRRHQHKHPRAKDRPRPPPRVSDSPFAKLGEMLQARRREQESS
jgi:hypothetical protein